MAAIDWAATGSMLQGIGSVVGSVAVIVVAIIGSRTFDNWKRQKLAERHIEQAERILTATYKVRRWLSHVRNPIMLGYEIHAAEEQLKATGMWGKVFPESRQRSFSTAQAYYNRLDRSKDDRRALDECQPVARALFGETLERAIEQLNRQFWTVQVYVDANRDGAGADRDLQLKIDSTIWEGYPSTEENEMDQIIVAQVKLIESICIPILRIGSTSNEKN